MNWIESFLSALRLSQGPGAAANVPDLIAGVTAKRAGQTAEALAAFERAAAHPTTQTEQVMIVRLMVETHLAARQVAAARALTEKHPPQGYVGSAAAHAWLASGMVAEAEGNLTAAGEAYSKAVKACREAANPPLEGLAMAYGAALDLQAGSADYAVKVLREALPKMLNVGEQENSSYFQGILGQALIATGQETTGAGLIGQALETAVRLNDIARIRLWSFALAERAFADARHFDADTHLSRALPLFPPDEASEAHVRTLTLYALNDLAQDETTRAVASAERACALAEAPDISPVVRQRAREARALALKASGQLEDAIAEFAALAESAALSPRARRQYAAALADTGRPAEALAVLEAMKAAHTGTLEEALALRDIGLVHMKAGQMTQAIAAWVAAVPLCEAQHAWATAVRVLCEISLARRSLGQTARALKDIDAALMLLTRLSEHEVETRGVVLSHAANAYAETGDIESTDAFFTEAIAIAARVGDRAAEAMRLGNYGWFLMQIGRPRSAVVKLERALELGEALDNPVQRGVHFDSLGSAFDQLNDFASGYKYHEDAAALLEAAGATTWLASCRVNWAMTCLSLGELERARDLLGQALSAVENMTGAADVRLRAETALANLAVREKQPDAALTTRLVAEARALENRRLLADALAVHSQTLADSGDAEGAKSAWDEATRLFTMMHMPQARMSPAWLSGETDAAEPRPSDLA